MWLESADIPAKRKSGGRRGEERRSSLRRWGKLSGQESLESWASIFCTPSQSCSCRWDISSRSASYGNFHDVFIRGHVTLIGCPKLDEGDYAEKLTQIISGNDIKSVTIVRMEVPCCGGIENAVKQALQESGKFIPWNVVTISTDGKILE